tara:strand:- start:994 stop:1164 length:171 start_codon:yes stop_codon:yes gene_type:complete
MDPIDVKIVSKLIVSVEKVRVALVLPLLIIGFSQAKNIVIIINMNENKYIFIFLCF